MAEVLAGFLTSAVVNIAKDKLASAIAEQANLLWNFGDDLENMNSVLESISAELQDAERRSVKEKLVQLWLKRLKNAAFDISDLLDDYQDTSDRLTAAKIPNEKKMKFLQKTRVLSCLPVARKKIAVANRMKNMREELRKINDEFHSFNFTLGGTSTSVEQHYDIRETSSLLPEEPIIGRNGDKREIIKLLLASTNNDETVILPIYGLGGMGKSTLAQLVYNDAQFKKYDYRIWVYVSRDFNLKKIGSSIISQLPIEGGQQNWDTLHVINQCLEKNLLCGKKVLIVLDDLWEEKDTELGKLRSMLHVGKKCSMIDVIVTTRKEDIARKVSTTEPYKLQPLKDDTCWEIIKRYSKFEQKHNQERLEQIGLDIAKKCGGVALAAQALGYMLQYKDMSGWVEINNSDIWNESSEDNGGVLPSLKLSYERMPPQLRMCFSYCAIFPKGHNITEDDLIHQWIALGFIKPSMGKEYIRQLLGMSFLQVSKLPKTSGDHMVQYTMHDLVHDLATLIIGDELMVSSGASKSTNAHRLKYCRYALVTKYDQEMKLSVVLPSKVRALHFSDSSKLDLLGQLVPPMSLKDFSLEYYSSPSFPSWLMDISHHLPNLTSIALCNLPACSNLPPLGQLPLLESLRLWYLSKVAKIDMSICGGKGAFPRLAKFDLGCMYGLEEWTTTYPGEDGVEEFMFPMLDELHVYCCPGLRLKPCPPKCRKCTINNSDQVISSLEEVQTSSHCCNRSTPTTSLAIMESECHSCRLFHHFPALQELELSSCHNLRSLPEGIQQLSSLQSLELEWCNGISALPEWLRNISSLKRLAIRYCKGIKSLPPCIQQLTNLQKLVVAKNGELQQWCKSEENKAKLAHINSIIYE
ncbi:disease resistance protein RGA2-like [Panicum virgatum]|uniref:disease resistance protein RGA2-like n=1 Tax=Panicum virgatum TaxID=38727 RepID=UPI0019D689CD|nr:disease resistance protein RGA2-like [Panicum virgatum]